jgi:ribosomal protein S18 acetylase RimI-like enzyme
MGSEVDGIFTGYVWEQGGRVVGNVTVNRPTGHPWRWQISNVAVLDTCRRQGIGRKLVEAAIDLILRRGGRTAYLFVRDDNASAIHLYESLGFAEIDSTTELAFDPRPGPVQVPELRVLRPLRPQDGEALYGLVSRASGSGYRWLHAIRRRQYAPSWDERLARWVGSLFSAQTETRWGVSIGGALDVGVSLRAARQWNTKPHRLQLWIHPDRRGQVEEDLSQDVVTLLLQQPWRSTNLSLPDCEGRAVETLLERGFRKIRTLILMKMEL